MMGQYANKVRKGNVTSISCGKSSKSYKWPCWGLLYPDKSMTLEHYHSSPSPVRHSKALNPSFLSYYSTEGRNFTVPQSQERQTKRQRSYGFYSANGLPILVLPFLGLNMKSHVWVEMMTMNRTIRKGKIDSSEGESWLLLPSGRTFKMDHTKSGLLNLLTDTVIPSTKTLTNKMYVNETNLIHGFLSSLQQLGGKVHVRNLFLQRP